MTDASAIYYPVVGWRRHTECITFTAASAHADYPASNLSTLPLANIWQSTSVTGQWIKGALDKARGVRLFQILRHNFSNPATFRLRLYADDVATQADVIYDSSTDATLPGGQDIWPVVYGDEIEWEDDNFTDGKYTDDEKLYTVWNRPIWLPQIYSALSFRFDFTDPDNTDGFFRIGMIDVCQGAQSSRGVAHGQCQLDFEVRTRTVTAYGGTDYHNRLTKKRLLTVPLPFVPRDQAMGVFYELARQHDMDVPFSFILDPYDTKNWLRTAGLFKHAKLTALQRASKDYESLTLQLKEAF